MRRKPQHTPLRIGDRLQRGDLAYPDSTVYIITQIDVNQVILISLSSGNRWASSEYRGILHPYLPWEAVQSICNTDLRFRVLGRENQPTVAEIYGQ